MNETVAVTINGRTERIAAGTTVAALLRQLNLNQQQVAVEVNLELVPRERHLHCILQGGDSIEVVTLVGGG